MVTDSVIINMLNTTVLEFEKFHTPSPKTQRHLGCFTQMVGGQTSRGGIKKGKHGPPYANLVHFIQNSEAVYLCGKPALNVQCKRGLRYNKVIQELSTIKSYCSC